MRPMSERTRPPGDAALVPTWGSDAILAVLRAASVPYAALNPGSSLRGIHDRLVHVRDGGGPELLLCLREEHDAAELRTDLSAAVAAVRAGGTALVHVLVDLDSV